MMKVENETSNQVYDSEHPECSIRICNSQGQLFEFITALDRGMPHASTKKPHPKHSWGRFIWGDEEGSILGILRTGGKWPVLKAS